MALSQRRRFEGVNYWPGFVDALSTMLLVIIFLLSVFMLAQFFLSREVTGKDTALAKLNQQIEQLTSLLALERSQKTEDQTKISALTATPSALALTRPPSPTTASTEPSRPRAPSSACSGSTPSPTTSAPAPATCDTKTSSAPRVASARPSR